MRFISYRKIFFIVFVLTILNILTIQKIVQTELYQKLLENPDFQPCKPVGCGIDVEGDGTPVCFQGQCSPCRRDGQCVLAYRVYMDELHVKAKCSKIYGTCSKQ